MEATIGPFTFTSNFECGNLARVERVDPPGSNNVIGSLASNPGIPVSSAFGSGRKVPKTSSPNQPVPDPLPISYEFNLWTRPDCAGTEFENNNRTWFFFGIKGGCVGNRVRINVMNLNKQSKLFSQGMQPVMQCISSSRQPRWERIKEKCSYRSEENSTVITWVHIVNEASSVTHYAFTYPYTYTELQTMLDGLDRRFPSDSPCLYYHRELLVHSLDHWRVDLITISSHKGRSEEREDRLPGLFPQKDHPRPFRFPSKKVVFVSARVHPGETSSSFVLNGFLNFILSNDPRAVKLRDLFVFKLIPFLNPDGVVRGHYRTDQRGVNLNRVYIDPSPVLHPTIYAARQIILYHHHGLVTPVTSKDAQSLSSSNESNFKSVFPLTITSDSDADKMTCKVPPVVMDEDTCHSFSDVQSGKAGGLGSGRIRGTSLMDLDEPSASGWDISSNISIEGNAHNSSFQRGLHPSDVHDDCSNVSSISEAETGVTSMFDSLAAVSDFTNIIAVNNKSCSDSNRAEDTFDNVKTRELISKDFRHEESGKRCEYSAREERALKRSLGTSQKKDYCIYSSNISSSEVSASCANTLQISDATPFSGISCSDSSQHFKVVHICDNENTNVSQLDTLGREVSNEQRDFGLPSTSFNQPYKPLSTNLSAVPSIHTKEISGIASSSESEAECGRPGREAEINSRMLDTSLHLPMEGFNPSLGSHTSIPKETQVSSGLFLYVDLHGHASKRGIFIYGNWYEDPAVMVENMLFPKLMAVNCPNFDFAACNFSERNMYLKDRRDGMSKEGSGRVAIMRATGLLRSYTLECNYNTGRTYNPIPPSPLDHRKAPQSTLPTPPKYSPAVFEDCGRQLGVSLLDLVGGACNWSRIPQSQYGSLAGVRTWLHHFLTSSALSPRTQTTGPHTPRTPASRTSNKLTVERLSSRNVGSGPRLAASRPGPPSTPASPRLPRTRGQRVRRHSWCLTVDAENQEPQEHAETSTCPRPVSAKKPLGSGSHSPRYKQKVPKIKTSPKKPGVSRSLTFTELGESSHIGSGESKLAGSKMNTCKHSLTANVSFSPNLNIKLSISDTPESPTLVKKVEKIRRQRSKGLTSGTKKLKVSPTSSSSTEEAALKGKESFYSLPSLDANERKCSPLSASQEGYYPAGQSPLSPRSPLSSVCEPQASHSPPGLSIITTSASCELHLQPKSPVVVTSPKKVPKVLSPSKRSSKHTLKSLSKSMDRLPAVPGAAGERLKLLPKKVKKKVSTRSVTDLSGTISSPPMKPATSQPTLDWIISGPPQGLSSEIDTVPPKIKKRKKNSRKSL
ncbi:Cytosolic carboxypeptidase-like protein 5 [Halocaridina rubra]|uniref:Cytosolic carboxypeptidase-like protein 5 n=1 Tax=Halocaridina rubra TaxID=373956 RepID=A0AAN9A354_HALRR